MNVRNNSYPALKYAGVFFSFAGLVLFIIFMFAGYLSYSRLTFDSYLDNIYSFIRLVILFPGLTPMLIIPWLLIKFKTPKIFFIGLLVATPLFVIFHFVVSAAAAHHDNTFGYYLVQFIELSLLPLFYWKRRCFIQ